MKKSFRIASVAEIVLPQQSLSAVDGGAGRGRGREGREGESFHTPPESPRPESPRPETPTTSATPDAGLPRTQSWFTRNNNKTTTITSWAALGVGTAGLITSSVKDNDK